MSHRKAKRIRRAMRAHGIPIAAEPYVMAGRTRYAAHGRRAYQAHKGRGT